MIYFDNAATSRFKPKCALKALTKEFTTSANGGRSGYRDAVNSALKIMSARDILKKRLNADEIIFTKNCTEALNLAIFGLARHGGNIVSTVNEHNSVLRPVFYLERAKISSLSIVNPDADLKINPEHIARMISPNTSLVIVNATSNVTGATSDVNKIGEICAEKGVPFLVDGAQAIPHIDIDMKKNNISFLACAGHKGLHGAQGTGFLAINGEFDIPPLIYGGTGTDSDNVYQPRDLPEGAEAGTLNGAGIAALGAAAEWTFKNITKIREKIENISATILGGLKSMKNVDVYTPDGTVGGVISFNIKNLASSDVGDVLNDKYHIAVRTGLHCAPLIHNHLHTLDRGAVRISVGYNNNANEADFLLQTVKRIASGKF